MSRHEACTPPTHAQRNSSRQQPRTAAPLSSCEMPSRRTSVWSLLRTGGPERRVVSDTGHRAGAQAGAEHTAAARRLAPHGVVSHTDSAAGESLCGLASVSATCQDASRVRPSPGRLPPPVMAPLVLKAPLGAKVRHARGEALALGAGVADTPLSAPQAVRSGRSDFAAGSLADSFRSMTLAVPAQAAAPAAFRVDCACPEHLAPAAACSVFCFAARPCGCAQPVCRATLAVPQPRWRALSRQAGRVKRDQP